jgi:hypothetical protein
VSRNILIFSAEEPEKLINENVLSRFSVMILGLSFLDLTGP